MQKDEHIMKDLLFDFRINLKEIQYVDYSISPYEFHFMKVWFCKIDMHFDYAKLDEN